MSMFSRMSDIFQSNINAMLDKAEDPKKVVRLIIQEMEETLVEVRGVAARFIAEQKGLEREQSKFQRQVAHWLSNAELAMSKGKEDLARSALLEKNKAQEKADALTEQLTICSESVEKLAEDIQRLQSKLAEARQREKSLLMREQTVSVRKAVQSQHDSAKVDDVMFRFDQYESRIDSLEAQLEAMDIGNDSLEAQFKALQDDKDIDAELAELKKKVA